MWRSIRPKHGPKVTCSQCHSEVKSSHSRPCDAITKKVDCAQCHTEVGDQYKLSTHGKLFAANDKNAPTCKECHGTHGVKGKSDPASPIFAMNVPNLCARCHQEGKKAALRYKGNSTTSSIITLKVSTAKVSRRADSWSRQMYRLPYLASRTADRRHHVECESEEPPADLRKVSSRHRREILEEHPFTECLEIR